MPALRYDATTENMTVSILRGRKASVPQINGAALAAVTSVVMALLLIGCDVLEPKTCTQIFCEDGVWVEVVDVQSGTYTVELLVSGVVQATVDCDGPGPCAVFVGGITPDRVTIRVTSETGMVEQTIEPEYQVERPNGPECPPECNIGRATISAQV